MREVETNELTSIQIISQSIESKRKIGKEQVKEEDIDD